MLRNQHDEAPFCVVDILRGVCDLNSILTQLTCRAYQTWTNLYFYHPLMRVGNVFGRLSVRLSVHLSV